METQHLKNAEHREVANTTPELVGLLEKIKYQNELTTESLISIREKLYAIHVHDRDNIKLGNENMEKVPRSFSEELAKETNRMLENNDRLRKIELHLSLII